MSFDISNTNMQNCLLKVGICKLHWNMKRKDFDPLRVNKKQGNITTFLKTKSSFHNLMLWITLAVLGTTFWNFESSMLFNFALVWLYQYNNMSVTDEFYVDKMCVWRTKLH